MIICYYYAVYTCVTGPFNRNLTMDQTFINTK